MVDLACGDSEGIIRLWDLKNKKSVATLETTPVPPNSIKIEASEMKYFKKINALVYLTPNCLVSAHEDGTIRIWSIEKKSYRIVLNLFDYYKIIFEPTHGKDWSKGMGYIQLARSLVLLPSGKIAIASLGTILIVNPCLRSLRLADIMEHLLALPKNTRVKKVNMQNMDLTDDDVDFLASLLLSTKIEQIDLRNTKISKDGARRLAAAVKNRETPLEILHPDIVKAAPEMKETKAAPRPQSGLLSYVPLVGRFSQWWQGDGTVAVRADAKTAAALQTLPERITKVEDQTKHLDHKLLAELSKNRDLFFDVLKEQFKKQMKSKEYADIFGDESLTAFYTMLLVLLEGTWKACQGIFSNYIANGRRYDSDLIPNLIDEAGNSLAFLGWGPKLLAAAIKGRNFVKRNFEIGSLAFLFAKEHESAEEKIREMVCKLTLTLKDHIKSLKVAPPASGIAAEIKDKAETTFFKVKNWLLTDGSNDPVKRYAREAFRDCFVPLVLAGELTLPINVEKFVSAMARKCRVPIAARPLSDRDEKGAHSPAIGAGDRRTSLATDSPLHGTSRPAPQQRTAPARLGAPRPEAAVGEETEQKDKEKTQEEKIYKLENELVEVRKQLRKQTERLLQAEQSKTARSADPHVVEELKRQVSELRKNGERLAKELKDMAPENPNSGYQAQMLAQRSPNSAPTQTDFFANRDEQYRDIARAVERNSEAQQRSDDKIAELEAEITRLKRRQNNWCQRHCRIM